MGRTTRSNIVSLSLLLICAIEQAAIMVFEKIIRSRPRRRASHSIAGGFRPTARAHTGLQQFSDTLTVVQVCRVTRDAPFSAKRRPKFISVTVSGVRFWERSTLSNWFNLYGNCYISVIAWGALFPGVFKPVHQVQHL